VLLRRHGHQHGSRPMTRDEITRTMERLTGGFDHRLAADTLTIWADELAELEFSPAYAAARDLIRNTKFFPKVAEFLTAYTGARHAQAGPKTDCRGGCDNGWMGAAGNTVVACSVCNPAVFARQMDGGYQVASRGVWEQHTPAEIEAARAHLAATKLQLTQHLTRGDV